MTQDGFELEKTVWTGKNLWGMELNYRVLGGSCDNIDSEKS